MPTETDPEKVKRRALEIFASKGSGPAAKYAQVSRRTIQRWAHEAGVISGFKPSPIRDCPSVAAYKRGCRCDGCKWENKEENRKVKARRLRRKKRGVTQVPHGVTGYSNWDCRCPVCRKAWSEYLRERRELRAQAVKGRGVQF